MKRESNKKASNKKAKSKTVSHWWLERVSPSEFIGERLRLPFNNEQRED